jgi:hypothetical protein
MHSNGLTIVSYGMMLDCWQESNKSQCGLYFQSRSFEAHYAYQFASWSVLLYISNGIV